MLLRLPPSLHYPITVTSLLKQPGDAVQRDEALFWYFYQTTVTEGDGLGNKIEVKRKFPTKFESTVDGEIVEWKVAKGDIIDEPYFFHLVPFHLWEKMFADLRIGLILSKLMSHVPTKSSSGACVRSVGRI